MTTRSLPVDTALASLGLAPGTRAKRVLARVVLGGLLLLAFALVFGLV